ncbi:MFS transporter [Actinomycetospora termitidis]|uniref:MFS transporter n=1 Tax=Actinomycetospora termitidis TaxID=3053470 RepID=A0ABT7M2E0_9PSEU|nr:MFS transporter [Actinomycetospora sp. Odt1-22]MDL5154830.1 MFS transporter [Actinomycetospora sp. Odt1-22]
MSDGANDVAGTASRGAIVPLYAAGFVTAFGSHGIAANLGFTGDLDQQLLTLGILLALYDGAEIILKPVFGALADRVGLRPVLLGGLFAFAVASAAFVLVGNPALLGLARFAQGAAAAAFSPSAGALIGRIAPRQGQGRAFGSYGAWKGLGYTAGPLLGGVLVAAGGYALLFTVLTVLAIAVFVWAVIVVPNPPPLPRRRQGLGQALRGLADPGFLPPTLALASSAAALSCGVGFLPLVGAADGLSPVATGAAVSVLAIVAAVSQPLVGRVRDAGRLPDRVAIVGGILLTAIGLAVPAVVGHLVGLLAAAVVIGLGTAMITPVAFAVLAASSPEERLGQTMGSAEIGREFGEAGGPFLTGLIAAGLGLGGGFLGIAAIVALTALGGLRMRRTI